MFIKILDPDLSAISTSCYASFEVKRANDVSIKIIYSQAPKKYPDKFDSYTLLQYIERIIAEYVITPEELKVLRKTALQGNADDSYVLGNNKILCNTLKLVDFISDMEIKTIGMVMMKYTEVS